MAMMPMSLMIVPMVSVIMTGMIMMLLRFAVIVTMGGHGLQHPQRWFLKIGHARPARQRGGGEARLRARGIHDKRHA